MTGKRLQRQLNSLFGTDEISSRVREICTKISESPNAEALDQLRNFAENFPAFLTAVDMYYEQLDDRASLAQQTVEMSEQELAENSAQLVHLNQLFEAMVNSLGQGFFIFDRDGFCLATYSAACETLLECNPAGIHVSEVLKVAGDKRETFLEWVRMLFEEVLDFDDLIGVAPKLVPNTAQRIVTLEYKPVRDSEGHLQMVVVIATDRTLETKARKEAQKMHAFATLMTNILKDKDRFRRFIQASRQLFSDIYKALAVPDLTYQAFAGIKRNLHTLKGATNSFGVVQVSQEIHQLESKLTEEPNIHKIKALLQGAVPEIDKMFEGVLDEYRDVLSEFMTEKEPSRLVPITTLTYFAERIRKIGPEARNLHADFLDEVVAVPMRRLFGEFDSTIQQVANKLGKKVSPIKFIGDDVSVMSETIDSFRASLIHIFRNIVDHGIEPAMIRDQRGKPESGQVVVEFRSLASSAGPFLRIIISDDGNGIDVWQIRTKMEKQGQSVEGLGSDQIIGKIFDAGFSTASAVTEFSGRGVGLDAVKYEVERLGGSISVRSELGKGSAFIIELPLDSKGNFLAPEPQKSVA